MKNNLPHAPGLYTCKRLLFSKLFFLKIAWPKPNCGAILKAYIDGPGHMTKMAATPIYGKKTSKISRTGGPMILKLSMQDEGLKLYKIYINDDPGLTLTYFTARSNWVAYMFEWGKLLQSHLMGKTCSKELN